LCQTIKAADVVFLDGSSATLEKDLFQLTVAQEIHKNVVRVPEHLFESVKAFHGFERYLHGKQTLGLVGGGAIQVEGLKDGIHLRWSIEEGVSIEKDSSRSQE
jgi:hypothetical protein